MRVLFVSSSSGSRGGGEFYLVYLAEALRAQGIEVGLWLSSDSQMDGIAELFGETGSLLRGPYTNTYLRRGRSLAHVLPVGRSLEAAREQWLSFRPDIIHFNKQCLEDGLDLLQAADTLTIPHGCTIHITQTAAELKARLGGLRDWIARRALLRYRGQLWAIAENRSLGLSAFLQNARKVTCIPNGVRIPDPAIMEEQRTRLRSEYSTFIDPRGPVAVSVGRLEEQKDPFRFLEIMQQWKHTEARLSALWVGDGRLREAFEAQIQEMGAADWIRCLGWQESAAPFLSMADVYVHPARFEGLPFALLEAMAHGLPCVISPELAEDLKDMPRSTWILAEADPESWRGHLADRKALLQRGEETRTLAKKTFSIEAMALSYVRLYSEMRARWQESGE
jgi:glycosyltransferase involved in cell wall biosynthesis